MINSNCYKRDIVEYIAAFFIYLTIPPYFVWKFNLLQPIIVVLFILLAVILNKKISSKYFLFCVILSFLYSYFAFKDGKNLIGISAVGLLCFTISFPLSYMSRIFEKFVKLYSLTMIPSIIVYIIVLLGLISLPSNIIPPLNGLKDYHYIQYPFLLLPSTFSGDMFRFMAVFDEPGVVGTISGVIILLCGIRFKKWDTYPILLSGILSFSLAFYLILFAYILLFQSLKAKIISVCLLLTLSMFFFKDDFVNERLFERMKIENGQLAGINRTVSTMDAFMERYVHSEKFLWGYGENYAQKVVNKGGASYKDLIINYGILGFLLFLFITIVKGFRELGLTKEFLIYLVLVFSIIYQRPFIFSFVYFFLLYIPLFYLKVNQNKSLYHYG